MKNFLLILFLGICSMVGGFLGQVYVQQSWATTANDHPTLDGYNSLQKEFVEQDNAVIYGSLTVMDNRTDQNVIAVIGSGSTSLGIKSYIKADMLWAIPQPLAALDLSFFKATGGINYQENPTQLAYWDGIEWKKQDIYPSVPGDWGFKIYANSEFRTMKADPAIQ